MNKRFNIKSHNRLNKLLFLAVSIMLWDPQIAEGQNNPTGYLFPMDAQRYPSGSFGELREGHLHAGIDIKTNGIEGIPVRAASGGYISRVKVSPGGYGYAVYITHPDGTTSVYGHLSEFAGNLFDTTRLRQFNEQNFAIEFFPDKSALPVKKGEVIGYSGNSGSSQGPHLHFETRHSGSEKPFDPGSKGITYKDTIAPVIKSVYFYEAGTFGWLAGSKVTRVKSSNIQADTLPLAGESFIGIETSEQANNSDNQLGLKEITVLLDDSLVFFCRIDSFTFAESGQSKAMTDPGNNGIFLCLKLPANELPFYRQTTGKFSLTAGQVRNLKVEVKDALGNAASFTIPVIGKNIETKKKRQPPKHITDVGFEPLEVRLKSSGKGFKSKISILPDPVVFKTGYPISFKKVKQGTVSPFQVVLLRNGVITGKPVKDGNQYRAQVYGSGTYTLGYDNTAPVASPPAFKGFDMHGNLIIEVPYTEAGIGLKKAKILIDGEWALSEFFTNRKVVLVRIPSEKVNSGNSIEITLTDGCDNSNTQVFVTDLSSYL